MTFRRVVVLALLVSGLLLASMVRIKPASPPVEAFTIPLAWAGEAATYWESPPVRATATVAGLGWTAVVPDAAWVRSSADGTTWSDWTAIPLDLEHGPDPGGREAANERRASGPVYVGESDYLQFRVAAASPEGLRAELVETAGRGLSLWEKAAHLWQRVEWADPPAAEAIADQPSIIPRSAWGADACLAQSSHPDIEYNRRVSAVFIHHTATSNARAAADPLAEIYAICRYHVVTKGWWDIAYNFLIGPDGTIYEGRHGGIDEPVRGAHTRGLNSYSMGIGLLGTHTSATPSVAQQQAIVDLVAWKFDLDHVDPVGTVTLENLTDNLKFEEGEIVTLKTVSGHRDAAPTSCPGSACYPLLPSLRARIESTAGNKIYWQPSADPIGGFQATGYEPVTFSMRFTESMAWSLEVANEEGLVVLREDGNGTTASVVWDGTRDSEALPYGEYLVTVTAIPDSGGEVPRSVSEWVQLGSFLPPFSDDEQSVHQFAIVELAERGITKGCNPPDNDQFCPDDPVTRGEMAAFLSRALRLAGDGDGARFTDDDGSMFESDIERLEAAGITKGCNPPVNDRYCPDDHVTRGQMAAFLVRAFGLVAPGAANSFQDDAGSIFEADINTLAATGITRGCNPPDNTEFCPDRTVTRAEMATFLIRSLNR